ncbi:MAG: hypothetical protein FWE36_02055 [Erysipelotrichales bacterium]|nr:hypothetical protein [Erysipelotrichales bacterium]
MQQIIDNLYRYNLLILYSFALLFFVPYFVIGFIRGFRKQRFKAISNLIIFVILFLFLLNPISRFVYSMNIRFIMNRIGELSFFAEFYSSERFPGSINIQGLVHAYFESNSFIMTPEALSVLDSVAMIFVRLAVAIFLLIIIFPLIKFICSIIWHFKFRDKKYKRKLEEKRRQGVTDKTFRKRRLLGALTGATYGLIFGVILMMPLSGLLSIAVPNSEVPVSHSQSLNDGEDFYLTQISDAARGARRGFVGSLFGLDRFSANRLFFIEANNQRINLVTELNEIYTAFEYILRDYTTDQDFMEFLLEMSEEDFTFFVKTITRLELIDPLAQVAILGMHQVDFITDWANNFNIDLAKLQADLAGFNFNHEFEQIGIIAINIYGMLLDLGIGLNDITFEDADYLEINPQRVHNILNALGSSNLFINILVPTSLQVLLNHEFILELTEDFATRYELEYIANLFGPNELEAWGNAYDKFLQVGFTSFQDLGSIAELTEYQLGLLEDLIDACFESKLFSAIIPLTVRFAFNSHEQLRNINEEIFIDFDFAEETKTLLRLFWVVLNVNNSESFELQLDADFLKSISLEDFDEIVRLLKNLQTYQSAPDVFGLLLISVLIEDDIIVYEQIDWLQENTYLLNVVRLAIIADLDLTALSTNIMQIARMQDAYIDDFAKNAGNSLILIDNFIKPAIRQNMGRIGLRVDFEGLVWESELRHMIRAFRGLENTDNLQIGDLLVNLNVQETVKSVLLTRMIIDQMDTMVNSKVLFLPLYLRSEGIDVRNDFYKNDLVDFLYSIREILVPDYDGRIDLDNFNTNDSFMKLYANSNAENPYETRDIILRSVLIKETLIERIIQLGDTNNQLVFPTDRNEWHDTLDSEGNVIMIGELRKLIDAAQILVPDGVMTELNLNRKIQKFYDLNNQNILLQSLVVRDSIIKSIEESPLLMSSRASLENNWDIELPYFFRAAEIIIADEDMDSFIFKYDAFLSNANRLILLRSLVIEETAVYNLRNRINNGSLRLVREEDINNYNDASIFLPIDWYRANRDGESELDRVLMGISILIDFDASTSDYTEGQIFSLNINSLSPLSKEANRDIIFASILLKETFIQRIPDINTGAPVFVKTNPSLQYWANWSDELNEFIIAAINLFGSDISLTELTSPNTLSVLINMIISYDSGDSTAFDPVKNSIIFMDTLNHIRSGL